MDNKSQNSFLSDLKHDIPSGLVVFLVALPLCLGIALASGAPLFAGIITGIVGGIVVSSFSGSALSVSGPAAGLTVIVLAAIQQLGYPAFLLAVLLGGIMQVALGLAKAGSIGHYFPSSVIKGMLAAIGVILILKQIPHAFGYDDDYLGDISFFQSDSENTFSELFRVLDFISIGAIVISVGALSALLAWQKWVGKRIQLLPAPLIAVLVGVLINEVFKAFLPEWAVSEKHLVQIPIIFTADGFQNPFQLPAFNEILNPAVWSVAVTIAIVASLETLLSLEAIDKLDTQKRKSPTNQELKAQGIGNIVASILGGLPMTAVIVRGAANVSAGAVSKKSSFTHGLLLLICVLGIPFLLNKIPFACLAMILLVIGYKLTSISLYKNMYKAGLDQFIPFIVTVLAIVFTDLLKGICIGLAVGIFYILRNNMKNTAYFNSRTSSQGDEGIKIVLSQEVTFLNKAKILEKLSEIPNNSKVIIDGSESVFIDYDVLEIIHDFKKNERNKGLQVELIGIKDVYRVSAH